jgi:hypothetical protein
MRWWMWVVAVVLVLSAASIAFRLHGFAAYREIQDELRTLGFSTTMEELVAQGPSVDQDRQERLYRLMNSRVGWVENISFALPFQDLQELRPSQQDLIKRDGALTASSGDIAAIAAILAEGPIELSLFGWCERDPVKLRSIDILAASSTRLPNLLSTRAIANWLGIRACLDADPEPHLRSLDRLIAGMDHPGTLIDAMIGVACRSIRDQTHLWLASRGRLITSRLQFWSAETPMNRSSCAAGFAGERCLFQEPLSRMSWRFSEIFGTSSNVLNNTWMLLRIWPMQGYEAAHCCSAIAGSEATLLGKQSPSQYPMPFGYQGLITAIAMPNLDESGITATEGDNRHRILRCAAIVAETYRRMGTLPDAMPLTAPAAGIDANLPLLVYEILTPSRFRIGIDPLAPRPPAIPIDRWKPTYLAPAIGTPPLAKAASDIRCRWSLEIDLDAILIPPPEKPARVKAKTK